MARELREISIGENKPVARWIADLDPQNRAKAERQLRMTSQRLKELGSPSSVRKFRDLWELRWNGHAGVPHRIFYTLACCSIVLLSGFTHKGQVYDPPGVYETALKLSQRLDEEGVRGVRVFSEP